MALKLSGSISLTGSLATDSSIVATVVTSSFFTGSYLDSLGNSGSADEILISDGQGGAVYGKTASTTGNTRIPASANDFSITWEGGLNFSASAGKVYMPGELDARSQQGNKVLTLSAGDSTHPRFDVFIFSASSADANSGSIEVIEGTPSENPVYPDINYSDELPLKFVLLKANAAVPSDGSDETNTSGADFSSNTIYSDNANDGNSWLTFGNPLTNANITSASFAGFGGPSVVDYEDITHGSAIRWPRSGNFNQDNKRDIIMLAHPQYSTPGAGLSLGTLDNFILDIKFPTAITGSKIGASYARSHLTNNAWIDVELFNIEARNPDLPYNYYPTSLARAYLRFRSSNGIDLTDDSFQKLVFPSIKFNRDSRSNSNSKVNFIKIKFWKDKTNIIGIDPSDVMFFRNFKWDDGSGASEDIDPTGDGVSNASLNTITTVSNGEFTGSFTGSFKGTFLDQLGESGSADQILVTDGSGGSTYKTFALPENTGVQPASANKFSISWQDNLNFTASAASVYIAGEDTARSQLGEKNITLAPADSTHPRFDVFIFSGSATDPSSGSVEVVQGTASANPIYPDIDPGNEVPLKFVLIKAGAVIPADGSNENDTSGADFAESTVFSDNADDGNSWKSFGSSATSANITTNTGKYGSSYFDQFDYANTLYGNAIKWPRTGTFRQVAGIFYKDRFGFWHPDYNSEGSGLTLGTLDALEFDLKMPTSVTGSRYWQEYVKRGSYQAYFNINLTEAQTRNSDGTLDRVAPAAFARVNFKDFVDLSRDDFQKISIPASSFQGTGNGGAGSKIIFIDGYLYKRSNTSGPFPPAGDGLYIKNLRWVDGSGTPVQLDPTGDSISQGSAASPAALSGKQNTLSSTAVSSVVVSGENNRVTTKRSIIGSGRSNLIEGNTDSVIGGGSFNSSSNACTFIGGGSNNILTGSAVSSSIIGGLNNSSSLANTHIIGSNITADKANYTYVNNLNVEGVVSGSTFSGSFVGDGSGLTGISGGGGADSDWYDGTTYISSSVGIQVTGSIEGTTKLTIGLEHTNNGTLASIAGGQTNCLNSANCSFIGAGRNNSISGTYGVIGGGVINCLQASFSSILGGAGNCIASSANHNSIIGGRCNFICGVIGTPSHCNLIGGGQCNILKQGSCHTSIINGCLNTGSADFGAILGGSNNNLQHNCSFIIGDNITSDKACYTFMNNLDVAGTVSGSLFSGSFVGSGFVSSSAQTGSAVTEIITLAQSQYDALTPASDVLYVIV